MNETEILRTKPIFGFDLECRISFMRLQPEDIVVLSTDMILESFQHKELKQILTEWLRERGYTNHVLTLSQGCRAWFLTGEDREELIGTLDERRADYAARGGDPDDHR